MNPRLATALGGLAVFAIALVLLLSGGSGGEGNQAPDLPEVEKQPRSAAPQPNIPITREKAREYEGYFAVSSVEVIQPDGSDLMVGQQLVPVYDMITGEKVKEYEMAYRLKRPKVGDQADMDARTYKGRFNFEDAREDPVWRRPDAKGSPGRKWGNWKSRGKKGGGQGGN
jgi:hypothetical protein